MPSDGEQGEPTGGEEQGKSRKRYQSTRGRSEKSQGKSFFGSLWGGLKTPGSKDSKEDENHDEKAMLSKFGMHQSDDDDDDGDK